MGRCFESDRLKTKVRTKENLSSLIIEKWCKITESATPEILRHKADIKDFNYDLLLIEGICTTSILGDRTEAKEKIYPVAGLDISMQRADSKYLCISGWKYLERERPTKFEELRLELLKGQLVPNSDIKKHLL